MRFITALLVLFAFCGLVESQFFYPGYYSAPTYYAPPPMYYPTTYYTYPAYPTYYPYGGYGYYRSYNPVRGMLRGALAGAAFGLLGKK